MIGQGPSQSVSQVTGETPDPNYDLALDLGSQTLSLVCINL